MSSGPLVYGGLALWSAWTALFSFEDGVLMTLLLRFAAAFVIALGVFGMLFGFKEQSLSMLSGLYLLFFALPVVGVSFIFGALKDAIGTLPYVAALITASAVFVVTFMVQAGVVKA
ncbi:hypothetical protein [Mesorhizobium sp. M7A.F.Ce.TU.012.03.2.1]|uniref:hypothetical protein n=1 Tax=Mesorhizobium sp. M7A.F.Ce.TU.012.03.2.1 TaxID=2493681 RepID=UPI000FD94BD4|nr:hypothetical protein [Mesorhizobium sp. M7A.F.Ce.TU.012.03.2.1]AZV21443.1 hypothetical protein EJ079_21600 [Mesorhizobium sp. M7A.F.Ce.TU.012.03.2.1]